MRKAPQNFIYIYLHPIKSSKLLSKNKRYIPLTDISHTVCNFEQVAAQTIKAVCTTIVNSLF
jgi:hypothetical protein